MMTRPRSLLYNASHRKQQTKYMTHKPYIQRHRRTSLDAGSRARMFDSLEDGWTKNGIRRRFPTCVYYRAAFIVDQVSVGPLLSMCWFTRTASHAIRLLQYLMHHSDNLGRCSKDLGSVGLAAALLATQQYGFGVPRYADRVAKKVAEMSQFYTDLTIGPASASATAIAGAAGSRPRARPPFAPLTAFDFLTFYLEEAARLKMLKLGEMEFYRAQYYCERVVQEYDMLQFPGSKVSQAGDRALGSVLFFTRIHPFAGGGDGGLPGPARGPAERRRRLGAFSWLVGGWVRARRLTDSTTTQYQAMAKFTGYSEDDLELCAVFMCRHVLVTVAVYDRNLLTSGRALDAVKRKYAAGHFLAVSTVRRLFVSV